jgi:cell wall-associated NlpC family hydrolase
VVLATSLTVASASPPSITSTRTLVDRLEAQLAGEQRKSEALSQRFDAVQGRLLALDSKIEALRGRLDKTRTKVTTTGRQLRGDAVLAYIYGSNDARSVALFTQNPTESAARGVYEQTVIGNVTTVESSYERQVSYLIADRRNLRSQRAEIAKATAEAGSLVYQNHLVAVKTNAELRAMSSRLRHLVLLAAIAAARQAARNRQIQEASGAAGVACQLGGSAGSTAATQGFSGSIGGSARGNAAGMEAFSAAESQIGVSYVWGGESRGVGFDCSGLTQWAWSRAGVSIPRTAAAQWYSLPHVSLSHLQPGDLLFYWNLDSDNAVDHVVMYGGSGPWGDQTTIAAAHTGTTISLQPAFTYGLIGAARP